MATVRDRKMYVFLLNVSKMLLLVLILKFVKISSCLKEKNSQLVALMWPGIILIWRQTSHQYFLPEANENTDIANKQQQQNASTSPQKHTK